jgi:hypothetical protein
MVGREKPTNESQGLVGGGGGEVVGQEEPTNESQGLVGGGGLVESREKTTSES